MNSEPVDLQEYISHEKRAMRRFLLIVGGVSLFIGLSIFYWNWSAAREWQRLKSDLEANGESFELPHLLPPAPPESENFGAIAALKDLPLIVDGDDERGDPAERRRAFISLSIPARASHGEKPTWKSGVQCGQAADMVPWAEYFRKTGILSMPSDSGNAATDLLVAIDQTLPVLKELDAATGRSASQFTPVLAERHWPDFLIAQRVPHYNAAQNAANVLRLRAVAAAHANDGTTATSSLLAMSKLSEAIAQEPFLIAHLVSTTLTTMGHAALWEGLNRRVFSADQLKTIQKNLERYDSRARLLYAIRTELVAGVNTIQHLKASQSETRKALRDFGVPTLFQMMPAGWFDQNATAMAALEWEHFIEPLKNGGLQAAAVKSAALYTALATRRTGVFSDFGHLLVNMTLPTMSTIITKSAAGQSNNDQAVAAVALERFFIRHQKYPATLQDLVPEFLSAPPLDGLTCLPLSYRLTDNGRYMIWTFGFDGIDDTGKVTPDRATNEVGRNQYRFEYRGDWVWQYTPVNP